MHPTMSRLQTPMRLRHAIAVVACAAVTAAVALALAQIGATLPARVETVYRSLDAGYREKNALDLVVFMDQFWRVASNPGFDATVDRLRTDLSRAGFKDRAQAGAGQPRVWVDEFANSGRGWDHRDRCDSLGAPALVAEHGPLS